MLKKRTKAVSRNSVKGKKIVKRKNSFSLSSSIYSSIIIFAGFISLSVTIFFFIKQLQPVIKNEKIKYLCTYQLGDKKNQNYRNATLELKKLVGDSDKYCKNFLIPNEKNKKGFRFFPIMKNILFRFI